MAPRKLPVRCVRDLTLRTLRDVRGRLGVVELCEALVWSTALLLIIGCPTVSHAHFQAKHLAPVYCQATVLDSSHCNSGRYAYCSWFRYSHQCLVEHGSRRRHAVSSRTHVRFFQAPGANLTCPRLLLQDPQPRTSYVCLCDGKITCALQIQQSSDALPSRLCITKHLDTSSCNRGNEKTKLQKARAERAASETSGTFSSLSLSRKSPSSRRSPEEPLNTTDAVDLQAPSSRSANSKEEKNEDKKDIAVSLAVLLFAVVTGAGYVVIKLLCYYYPEGCCCRAYFSLCHMLIKPWTDRRSVGIKMQEEEVTSCCGLCRTSRRQQKPTYHVSSVGYETSV